MLSAQCNGWSHPCGNDGVGDGGVGNVLVLFGGWGVWSAWVIELKSAVWPTPT